MSTQIIEAQAGNITPEMSFVAQKEGVSEERYEEIMEGVYDARISADKLEKAYFGKFRDILTCRKIYLVQRAEMSFHRELLKGMRGKGAPRKGRK